MSTRSKGAKGRVSEPLCSGNSIFHSGWESFVVMATIVRVTSDHNSQNHSCHQRNVCVCVCAHKQAH